jgi:hypothetical protein
MSPGTPQPRRQPRQLTLVAHGVQQRLGAPGAGREHHVPCRDDLHVAAADRPGALVQHPVCRLPTLGARHDPQPGHRAHRAHLDPEALGEREVVLAQRVLGAHPASDHAVAALRAAGAPRSDPAEVRVVHRLAGLPEEHPHRRLAEGAQHPEVVGGAPHQLLDGPIARVLDDPQHPARHLVVGGELGLPVGDVAPLRVVEERLRGHVERVRVVERAATHAGTGQDDDVGQAVDALDAVAPGLGCPQVAAGVPGGLGEVLVLEAPSGLEHEHPVALLGQPKRGDRATEARPDDHDVDVHLDLGSGGVLRPHFNPTAFMTRRDAVSTRA